MAKRITVTNNSNLHDSRVMLVPEHILSIRHLLVICSQKFGMNAQKLFLANGGEIDHIDMIRDDDNSTYLRVRLRVYVYTCVYACMCMCVCVFCGIVHTRVFS